MADIDKEEIEELRTLFQDKEFIVLTDKDFQQSTALEKAIENDLIEPNYDLPITLGIDPRTAYQLTEKGKNILWLS